jgi:hypothetical protein
VEKPTETLADVKQVAAGPSYSLAWKGPPANQLATWGAGDSPILDTLRNALGGTNTVTDVAQMSAADQHVLLLRASGSLFAGYEDDMKPYALPPPGLVKGRLARVSAGNRFSLGIDVQK